MYEGQTITDNGLTWKVKNVSNKPHSLPYIGGGGVINSRDEIYTSGTYTAPCDGWYQIILKGAGGGGAGAFYYSSLTAYEVRGGGGEGGTTYAYEYMHEGDTATITIGAGGTAGKGVSGTSSSGSTGTNGGNTIVIVNNNTYIADGGMYGGAAIASYPNSTIPGSINSFPYLPYATKAGCYGGIGCGPGGKTGRYGSTNTSPGDTVPGTGGGSGYATYSGIADDGMAGGNGYVWFLYFDPNK